MKLKKISTADMSREDWLVLRKKTIGGSDAAGIVGLSKYSSPYSVWADKMGLTPDKEDSEAMRQGRDLEEYVAQRFTEETGKKVHRLQAMLYNPNYPFAAANIDRKVANEKAGLECKTTSTLDLKQFNGVEFPEKYYAQCVHYLAVTGWDRWYLAVLVFGRQFYTFTLERDDVEIKALMDAEAEFWKCVETGKPPFPDGSDATTSTLGTLYPNSTPDTTCELFGREAMIKRYSSLKDSKAQIDASLKEIENTLKSDMKETETAYCGSTKISWKSQERSTFDRKKFEAANPGIDLTPYFKKTTVRPFKVTL